MYQVPEEIQSRSGVDTDADRVRGIIIASSFLEVANKPANLRKIGAVASIIGVGQLIFEGETIENADWENEINWKQYGGGTVEICDQADVELAEPTENTKATSSLRAWQGFVFWCKNTLFPELNTSDKTILGSVNELKTNVIKIETDETPVAIADTDNVRFKSATGYYNRTLLAIKNYVKYGLKASEVVNDSTKVTGATVKDVFDNAEEAVLATTVQDSDMFAGMRWENIGTGVETYNKYWTAEDMKAYFATSGALIAYVSTDSELSAALATEKETMQICATAGITSGSISNIYASNLWITGRKLIFDSGTIIPNSSSSRAVTRVFFDASVTMLGDDIEGACVFVAAAGIWHFTFRHLAQDMPIRFIAAGTSEIHVVCGNTITIDPASTGTYTVTHDSTLDLGQDDVRLDGSNVFNVGAGISANTEVLIKANTGFVTLATLGELTGISTGVAGAWSFIYDNGDVLVDGDASKSGRFGIKVAFKFKYRDTPFTCNLFPNASIGTWVRFEHADWCINADNTGGETHADLNQSFTVKGFFDAVSDLIQSSNYSNIAGAGTVSENQQDDGFRYLQSVQRIQRNACTFTIGTSIQASTKEVWLLIHLSGTML